MGEEAEFVAGDGEEVASTAADVENELIEEEKNKDGEVSPAIIAVHPYEKSVAVAVGSELRLFDLEGDCSVSLIDDSGGSPHTDSIRAIKFGANGRLFASAGDDKLVKIWVTNPWRCIWTVPADKRVSAVAISHSGHYVAFADKFGVVWLIEIDEEKVQQLKFDSKPVPILGHYCSIITRLDFSADDRFIVSADRDFKIRVTVFPKEPLNGAHEIQSFCLGHTDFVSCLAFVCPFGHANGFLLSGSGDSTVRLWDFVSGTLLATCEVRAKAGQSQSNGPDTYSPVTDLCASFDGSIIVAALQNLHGVVLLNCDFPNGNLSVAKVVSFEETYFPTSLVLSSSTQRLWMIMGASNLPMVGTTHLPTRLKVISVPEKDPSLNYRHDPVVLEDNEIPGGQKLLSELQGTPDITQEEATLAAAAAAVKLSMRSMMIKKEYNLEKREMRKKNRNDRKAR
ncbi:tRNA (guanine-N(7)-)-methyltransferase non-catalytic subunit wdr4-like [Zingiber officinale]|uniref:tRNA (guanine-N(7)-)-methyltransferase non-catalytic subunit n=1 Tax=Zingiber officinale TaxID=94328 RepID=A0A8J5GMZ1_ZINOF|nr:tRNA (guanine-N(7)-)-methyltransferase non-catalytic subunit wdr4-like [Zingiber officinale]KAG6509512.1 hypothetical protein ZIOFF_027505 [Zingiber officinale]